MQWSGTPAPLARQGEYHNPFSHLFWGTRGSKERKISMPDCFSWCVNICSFFLFQEVLELAFSILYDSSGQLNFIAPDKHEVSQVKGAETSLKPS